MQVVDSFVCDKKVWSPADSLDAVLVLLCLLVIASCSGSTLSDWISAAAVLTGFIHTQIASSLEAQLHGNSQRKQTDSLLVIKESFWAMTFISLQCIPLLLGALLFLSYPKWRRKILKCATRIQHKKV